MSRNSLTAEQIFQVWKQRSQKPPTSWNDIAQDLEIPKAHLANVLDYLKKYLIHPETLGRKRQEYVKAAELVNNYITLMSTPKEEALPTPTSPELQAPTPEQQPAPLATHYQKFDFAVENFLQAVEDFIAEENKEVNEKNRQLEQENDRLLILSNSARHSNWVQSLANKFGNKK